MRRTIVTGGLGFIGTHLVNALEGTDRDLLVVDSLDPDVHGTGDATRAQMPSDATVIEGDVRGISTIDSIDWEGTDVVHLAAKTGVGQSTYAAAEYTDVNTTGTAMLLDKFARHGAPRRLVLASSRAVYGEGKYQCDCGHMFHGGMRSASQMRSGTWEHVCPECGGDVRPVPMGEEQPPLPVSHYGSTKLSQEHLCQVAAAVLGFECVILRFFNVYGEGQSLWNPYTGVLGNFAVKAAQGLPVRVFEDGEMLRDFVHVSDAVEAIRSGLDVPQPIACEPINIAGAEPVTLSGVATRVAEELGAPPPIVTGEYRLGDVRHVLGTCHRAYSRLGYSPTVRLTEGLGYYLEWFSQQELPRDRDDPTAMGADKDMGVR